jgi:hypothetical protein
MAYNRSYLFTQMSNVILALLLMFSGAVVVYAETAAEQACIDKGLEITSDNDNAIMRVRSILEAPPVRAFVVSALHLTKIADSYLPPTLVPCMTLIEAKESGAGAKITYLYQWRTALNREFNQLSVYCDNTGHIDRVESGPSSNDAFSAFGDFLHHHQEELTKLLINKMTEPDNSQREDDFDKQVRE